jgi:hypothetical protein
MRNLGGGTGLPVRTSATGEWQRLNVAAGGFGPALAAAGWRWSFRIRSSAGDSLLRPLEEQHPTKRSAKMARLEAVLLVSESALTHRKLAQFATLADEAFPADDGDAVDRRVSPASDAGGG